MGPEQGLLADEWKREFLAAWVGCVCVVSGVQGDTGNATVA